MLFKKCDWILIGIFIGDICFRIDDWFILRVFFKLIMNYEKLVYFVNYSWIFSKWLYKMLS